MQFENTGLLYAGILLALLSFVIHVKGKEKSAILLLFCSALLLRLYIVHLDSFLHDWDERFHALVARNMMDHPFKPMLYSRTILPYDFIAWTENHIWLHKQPLFLWQMALSMKLFGVSEFAMRYPSALMGAIMVIFVYRISWLLSKDRLLAYGAALLMCFSNYQLELMSGFIGMDQNDVAFGFYVCASIWAYIESLYDKRWFWVILIGLFAGCAVLNKWLTGLLVFGAWGLVSIVSIRKPETKKEILRMLISLVVCLLVFVPWQIYILNYFPLESKNEFAYNSKHVFEAVENHAGSYLFYYEKLPQYFGLYTWQLVVIGLLLYIIIKAEDWRIKLSLCFCFVIVFLFFSFVVKTKMQSYFFVVAPIGYIFMAYALVKSIGLLKLPAYWPKLISGTALLISAWFLFNYEGIKTFFHDPNDPDRLIKIKNTNIYKTLYKTIKPGTTCIINLSQFSEVELMFYNKDLVAYHGNLNKESIDRLLKENLPIGVFKNHDRYKDADYLPSSNLFYLIDQDLGEANK